MGVHDPLVPEIVLAPNLIQEILPPDVIAIEIEKNLEKGFDYRKITISDPEEKKAQL